MYEKFDLFDVDAAGYGGEYTVQVCTTSISNLIFLFNIWIVNKAGFGWTNGILLWVAANYGNVLVGPDCPEPAILVINSTSSGSSSSSSSKSAAVSSRFISTTQALVSAVIVGFTLLLLI